MFYCLQKSGYIELYQKQLQQLYQSQYKTLCPVPWAVEDGYSSEDTSYDSDEMFVTLHTIPKSSAKGATVPHVG